MFDYSLIYLAVLNYVMLYHGFKILTLSGVLKHIFFTAESNHSLEISQENFDSENQPHMDENIEVDSFWCTFLCFSFCAGTSA